MSLGAADKPTKPASTLATALDSCTEAVDLPVIVFEGLVLEEEESADTLGSGRGTEGRFSLAGLVAVVGEDVFSFVFEGVFCFLSLAGCGDCDDDEEEDSEVRAV